MIQQTAAILTTNYSSVTNFRSQMRNKDARFQSCWKQLPYEISCHLLVCFTWNLNLKASAEKVKSLGSSGDAIFDSQNCQHVLCVAGKQKHSKILESLKVCWQHIKRFACLPITTCDEYDTYDVDFSGIINFNNWVTLPAEYVFLLPSSFDYLDQLITKSCLTGLALYLIGNFKTANDVTNVPSNF